MALDYQKTVYRGTSGDTLKRTTYSKMMQWRDYVEPPPANPYDEAYNGVFQTVTPKITTPRPAVAPPTCKQEKIPVPPLRVQQASVQLQTSPQETVPKKASPPVKQSESISKRHYLTDEHIHALHRNHGNYKKLLIPATETGRSCKGRTNLMDAVQSSPPHLNFHKNGGYDDFHKSYLKMQRSGVTPSYPLFGPPRLRNGKMGGGWRHLREVLQAGGKRFIFVEGGPRVEDNTRVYEGKIPAGNIIQGTRRYKTPVNQIEHLKMSAYDNYLTGVKGMERNNWALIR